jgi:hypothetical protein
MFSLMAVLVMVVSLMLVSCSDDDDDDEAFVAATPAALGNRIFTFEDGIAFDEALDGEEVVLTIGDFGVGNTAPFTLESGANTATGIVAVASCTYQFITSNFAVGGGPQAPSAVVHDPCEVDQETGAYRGTNTATGESSTSDEPETGTGGGGS